MAAINQEDLISSFIPDVVISQIVLETSGTPLVDNNPHIDVKSERVGRNTQTNDNLMITLHLVMKDKLSNDIISNWADQIEFQKYLKIKVFQSTDEKTTAYLSLSQDMFEIIDPDKKISHSDLRFKMAGSVFQSNKIQVISDKLYKDTKVQTINFLKYGKINKTIDDDGNEVNNRHFKATFVVQNSFPEHLAYFVVTTFDLEQLAQDFNLDYDTLSLKRMNGRVFSDVVIDNGDLVDRSYVFYDVNGKIWTGAVHIGKNGQWRSKSQEEDSSINLTRDIVANNKIQDFRNIKDIQKLQFDFSNINSKLGDIETKSPTNSKNVPRKIEEYFSDFHVATDRNGDAKFFFSVNYEKLIIDLSLYGGLIKKSGSRFIQEMMKQTKIKQMRILRRRVKHGSNLSRFGILEGIQHFDTNEADELIAISGEKSFGKFVGHNTPKGALKEIYPALDKEAPGVRHFTAMDKTMSDVTDGYYQYLIELDVDDGSLEFFKNKVVDLRDARAELGAYLNEASKLSLSKYVAEIQDPHIKHPSETNGTAERLVGNFDIDSNRFTQKFATQMARKYSGRNLRSAPWVAPITIYADVLDMFTDAFQSRRDRSVVLNSLFTYCSPKTGNPSGILAVLKLIDNLIVSLESIVGTVEKKSSKKHKKSSNKSISLYSGRNVKRSIKLTKYFNNIFDSNTIKGVGLDYLSSGQDDTKNDDGLKTISSDDFGKRINTETLRFFKDIDPDINLNFGNKQITSKDKISNTNFSYLSPARIDLPRKSISLLDNTSVQIGTSKKNRVYENINDGTSLRQNKFSHLHSTMIMQNLTKKPIAALYEKFGQNTKQKDLSITAIEKMLSEVLSEHGSVTIEPVTVEAVKNNEGMMTLKPIPTIPPAIGKNPPPDKITISKTETQASFIEQDNSGKNVFLKAITQGLAKNGATSKKDSDTQKSNNTKSGPIFSKTQEDVDLVSILDPKKLTIQTSGDEKIISGFKNPLTETQIKQLPNHLKSIMLFNASHGSVNFDKLKILNPGTAIEKYDNDSEKKFGFEMLKQIERLIGYGNSKNGPAMKNPLWKVLTEKDYNSLVGQEIVCRMVEYENKDIGLKRNKGIKAQAYDDYFILIPKKKFVINSNPITPTVIKTTVLDRIKTVVSDNFPGLVFTDRDDRRTSTDIALTNVITSIGLVDINNNTNILTREDRRPVRIQNKNIDVSTSLIIDVVAMDCQSLVIDQDLIQNNVIAVDDFSVIIQDPLVLAGIHDAANNVLIQDDIFEQDRCSAFGNYRPNNQLCPDKK